MGGTHQHPSELFGSGSEGGKAGAGIAPSGPRRTRLRQKWQVPLRKASLQVHAQSLQVPLSGRARRLPRSPPALLSPGQWPGLPSPEPAGEGESEVRSPRFARSPLPAPYVPSPGPQAGGVAVGGGVPTRGNLSCGTWLGRQRDGLAAPGPGMFAEAVTCRSL